MLLQKWAARYPEPRASCTPSGQSLEGREIWQITITNKKTGRAHRQGRVLHRRRPARRRDHRHRGDALLHQPRPHELRQGRRRSRSSSTRRRIYAKPHNNPDGASLYHYTAQTLRSTVRPIDNDGDGLFDEDAGGGSRRRRLRPADAQVRRRGQGHRRRRRARSEGPADAQRRRGQGRLRCSTPKASTTTATAA